MKTTGFKPPTLWSLLQLLTYKNVNYSIHSLSKLRVYRKSPDLLAHQKNSNFHWMDEPLLIHIFLKFGSLTVHHYPDQTTGQWLQSWSTAYCRPKKKGSLQDQLLKVKCNNKQTAHSYISPVSNNIKLGFAMTCIFL